ncbi:MAG: hypothetical protein ACFFET_00610 [Candidatus Thorarchaeota archaeon]
MRWTTACASDGRLTTSRLSLRERKKLQSRDRLIFLLLSCAFILVLSTAVSSGNVAEMATGKSTELFPSKLPTQMIVSDLPPPELIAPANGEIFGQSQIDAGPVIFEWEPVADAQGYEFMLVMPGMAEPIYISWADTSFQIWLNSASGIPGETDGDYSWAVRTLNGSLGEFSATWTFRIDTLYEGQPSLIAPLDGMEFDQGTATLDWKVPSDISGMQSSVIEVYNSSTFSADTLFLQETVPASTLNLTLYNLEEGTYFWRCQAFDIAGNPSDWSDVWNFTIEFYESIMPPAPPPTPTAPPVTTLDMGTHYVDMSGTTYVTSNTEFNLIASSEHPSNFTTMYSIDAGPWLEYNESFHLSRQDGLRNVSFYSIDEYGNTEDMHTIEVVLASLNLESSIYRSWFWSDRIMFTVTLENNWPLDICELEMNLDIPLDFSIRHLSVWLKEPERWPRPVFLFIGSCNRFIPAGTYNFMDGLEITLEDNRLFVPWLPVGGKLLIVMNLLYSPEDSMNSLEPILLSEYTFQVVVIANTTSPFDTEQGLVDGCSTVETLVMDADNDFDGFQFHDSGSHY